MARMQLLTAIIAFMAATSAHAGGWIGGGTGELTGDGANPWFLDIPEQAGAVTYCIEADEEAMGLSLATLTEMVARSFNYWRLQIASAPIPESSRVVPWKIKTHSFSHTGRLCDDTVDLAFQFGKLSTEGQRRLIADEKINLARYIGFAARLSYDENLRGRGFIYIAPESGPLRPQREDLVDRFWSGRSDGRLESVLTHELGHVFGVSHFGGASDLMGRDFPEAAVSSVFFSGYSWSQRPLFRSADGLRYSRCFETTLPTVIRQAFFLREDDRCLQLILNGDGLVAQASEGQDFARRATARLKIDQSTLRERYHDTVRLWLPDRRNVFKDVPQNVRVLPGPAVVETMASGILESHGSGAPSIPALLIVDPINLQVGATVDNGMVGDVLEGAASGWRIQH